MKACHCGERFDKKLCKDRCPFCFCGSGQDCADRRAAEAARRRKQDATLNRSLRAAVAQQAVREADCPSHQFVTVSAPSGHRSGLHVEQCRNCPAKRSFDTSD